jgi:hypothetical protein
MAAACAHAVARIDLACGFWVVSSLGGRSNALTGTRGATTSAAYCAHRALCAERPARRPRGGVELPKQLTRFVSFRSVPSRELFSTLLLLSAGGQLVIVQREADGVVESMREHRR